MFGAIKCLFQFFKIIFHRYQRKRRCYLRKKKNPYIVSTKMNELTCVKVNPGFVRRHSGFESVRVAICHNQKMTRYITIIRRNMIKMTLKLPLVQLLIAAKVQVPGDDMTTMGPPTSLCVTHEIFKNFSFKVINNSLTYSAGKFVRRSNADGSVCNEFTNHRIGSAVGVGHNRHFGLLQ